MERLTYQWNRGYAIDLPNALSGDNKMLEWSIAHRQNGLRLTGDIPDRLAAYEDTGLEPEEIKDLELKVAALETIEKMYDGLGAPDHLRELVQAEKDGRLSKYTIGDIIYDRFGDAWEVNVAELRLIDGRLEWLYRCGHAGTDDYRALWENEVLNREEAEAALKGGDST